jgi:2-methylcitrate dehydratase PrpD
MAGHEPHVIDKTTPIYTLSAYMAQVKDRELAPDVAARTKNHLLDTIGAIVSGSELLSGDAGIKFIRGQGGTPQAHVAGSDIVTTAINAAWANAMSAHADETDDHHNGSITRLP